MVEQIGLRFSDCIVVRGRYHRLYLRHRGFKSVVEIPDCADAAPFELDPRAAALRSALGLEGFLAVGVIGKLVWDRRHETCYGWDLVEALALLRDLPVKGVIIGDGDGRSHLERRAAELRVEDRLVFMPPVSIEEARTYVQVLDVGLSTQSDDLVGWVRTTGKLVQYLQQNRFVLATEVGQASWVLPREMLLPYSGAVDRDHPRRLAMRLASLIDDPSQLKLGAVGTEIVCSQFDVKKVAPRMAIALALARRRTPIKSSLNPKSGAA
jgi:glycosyltransferase involved in cell wall biosynthesis